jgi:hypothetical protein
VNWAFILDWSVVSTSQRCVTRVAAVHVALTNVLHAGVDFHNYAEIKTLKDWTPIGHWSYFGKPQGNFVMLAGSVNWDVIQRHSEIYLVPHLLFPREFDCLRLRVEISDNEYQNS